jgi:sugar-specific transcriptional regulator TrmB
MDKILASLGIDKEETDVYLALLELGPIGVGKLAQKMNRPRPSLYGFLKRLQEKGLVTESAKFGAKSFLAEPPEKVNLLFQQMIDKLQKDQADYKNILPELKKNKITQLMSPKLKLYEGEDALKGILRDVLIYSGEEFLTFWPPKPMIEALSSEFFRYFQDKKIEKNIFARALWPIKQQIDFEEYPWLRSNSAQKREIRFFPKEINFSMGFMIYGTKAAFISSKKESFGFIIESQEFAEMLKSLFEFFWVYPGTKKQI